MVSAPVCCLMLGLCAFNMVVFVSLNMGLHCVVFRAYTHRGDSS